MKMGRSERALIVLLLAMGFIIQEVAANSLSGSVYVTPLTGMNVEGGDAIVVDVNASLTPSDALTDINLSLVCTNVKPNSTTDVMALFSSAKMPTSNQVGDDHINASFGPLSLDELLEFSWITQWFVPDSVNPASTITCDVITSYKNSSLLVEYDILYSDALLVLTPKINLTNAYGDPYDGSSQKSVDIGEEIRIMLLVMAPQSNIDLEVNIGPTNESVNITAATDLAIIKASSRIVCGSKLTGQKCRTINQAVYPHGRSLMFYDDTISISGVTYEVNDLELQAKIRVGDDDVNDGDTTQVDLSMATGRPHIWTSTISFNISDNGDPRSTVMEVYPTMTTHSLYNGYEATVKVEVQHAASSRASGQEVELHFITSPRTTYQGVADINLLTGTPIINDSFVTFKIGTINLFSSVELLINLMVTHAHTGAGVSQSVNLVQAVYNNDTLSTSRGRSSLADVQFQYEHEPVPCKTPWQPFLSSCYYANASILVDAYAAAQICEEEGGSLASIDSIFEERFLVDLSPTELIPFRFWVLGNSTYTNWLPGQPDGAGACQSLVVAGSYWSDSIGLENGGIEETACSDLRYFICETRVDPPLGEAKDQFYGIPGAGQALTDGWTCLCSNYPSPDPSCACCKPGAPICNGQGQHVCTEDSSQCPLEEFYDRSILSDGTGLRIACNNVRTSSSEPSCVFSSLPSSAWKAFPQYIGDVIAYHNVSDTLYAIGRDSNTYLEGRFGGSSTTDWSAISTDHWMAARDKGDLTLHNLVTSLDYTSGDLVTWRCCG